MLCVVPRVGVLLRKLEAGLLGVSHIIVDEIHERDLNVMCSTYVVQCCAIIISCCVSYFRVLSFSPCTCAERLPPHRAERGAAGVPEPARDPHVGLH